MNDTFLGNNTGFLAGGVIDIQPTPYFSIQPGVVYSSRGWSGSGVTQDIHYLSFVIDGKMKAPVTPNMAFYGLAGLNLGVLLSASISGQDSLGNNVTENDKTLYNSIDFGLEIGGGVEFPTGSVTPFVEVVYYLGLTNLISQTYMNEIIAEGAPSDFYEANRGLEIRAGLKFPM